MSRTADLHEAKAIADSMTLEEEVEAVVPRDRDTCAHLLTFTGSSMENVLLIRKRPQLFPFRSSTRSRSFWVGSQLVQD